MQHAKPGIVIEGTDNPRRMAEALASALDTLFDQNTNEELAVMFQLTMSATLWRMVRVGALMDVGADDMPPTDSEIEMLIATLDSFAPDMHEFREREPGSMCWGFFPLRTY